jgi:hypothetical protein
MALIYEFGVQKHHPTIGIKYPFLISWREQGSNDCGT